MALKKIIDGIKISPSTVAAFHDWPYCQQLSPVHLCPILLSVGVLRANPGTAGPGTDRREDAHRKHSPCRPWEAGRPDSDRLTAPETDSNSKTDSKSIDSNTFGLFRELWLSLLLIKLSANWQQRHWLGKGGSALVIWWQPQQWYKLQGLGKWGQVYNLGHSIVPLQKRWHQARGIVRNQNMNLVDDVWCQPMQNTFDWSIQLFYCKRICCCPLDNTSVNWLLNHFKITHNSLYESQESI